LIGNLISSFRTQRVTTEVILTLTPHIVQAMTPPSLSRQAFWSGTDSTYSNTTMFTPHPKPVSTNLKAMNASSAQPSPTAQRGVAGKAPSASLTKMLTVGPIASITPNDSVVTVGKEFKITIHDERLRPDKEGLFHLQYDPNVLDLKDLIDAEVIQMDPAEVPSSAFAEAIVAFRVGASAPRAATGGRKVTARFMAKAPGVSPLRVALVNAHRGDSDGAPPDGKGIVRVR
jgi:general secretion pathway protein D